MDLLAKLQDAYSSSDEEATPKPSLLSDPIVAQTSIDLAPDVNIYDLQLAKSLKEQNHFALSNQLITKSNHLNGVIEQIHLDEGKFHEQYHNFQNFGHALNPSDNAGQQIVYSNNVNRMDLDSNVENL